MDPHFFKTSLGASAIYFETTGPAYSCGTLLCVAWSFWGVKKGLMNYLLNLPWGKLHFLCTAVGFMCCVIGVVDRPCVFKLFVHS